MLIRNGPKISRAHYGMPKDPYYYRGHLERRRMRHRAIKKLGGFMVYVALCHPDWLKDGATR